MNKVDINDLGVYYHIQHGEIMTLLIHDVEDESFSPGEKSNDIHIISDNGKIRPCIGCFGCWIKTPGQCVIKDGYDNMGEYFSKANRVIIISKCFYGSYSPFVKNILDKSISLGLPYFNTINGEMHHKTRYDNRFDFIVHFYGEITDSEKETAQKLVKVNGINIQQKTEIYFHKSYSEIKGVF